MRFHCRKLIFGKTWWLKLFDFFQILNFDITRGEFFKENLKANKSEIPFKNYFHYSAFVTKKMLLGLMTCLQLLKMFFHSKMQTNT